jgi:Zn-dependent protease with chaperone function
MLSNRNIIALATTAWVITPCLGADAIDRALDRLRYIEPLPRLSSELKTQVIAALPTEGEVKTLTVAQRKKVAAVAPVLRAHGSEADYLLKVVESPQARVALHARFVILMTDTALRVLTPAQLQAVISHEIGHAYFWDEYEAAQKAGDWARSRELELYCDGVAILTLRRLGATPETLIDGLRALEATNQLQGLATDPTRHSHPSMAERVRFVRDLAKRLAVGVALCPWNLKDTPDAEVCLWTRRYSGGTSMVLR